MKKFVALLSILALFSVTFAPYSATAGEVKKQPLKLDEAMELYQEQSADFTQIQDTEAGIKNGYGILGLALIAVVAVVAIEQIEKDSDDND